MKSNETSRQCKTLDGIPTKHIDRLLFAFIKHMSYICRQNISFETLRTCPTKRLRAARDRILRIESINKEQR